MHKKRLGTTALTCVLNLAFFLLMDIVSESNKYWLQFGTFKRFESTLSASNRT